MPGQEANDNNVEIFFDLLDNSGMPSVIIRMSTHNKQFNFIPKTKRKFP